MALAPEKLEAYRKAEYVVYGGHDGSPPDILFRIGERNPDLDALLDDNEARTAAFISAANPFGEPASEAENHNAFRALANATSAQYAVFPGEGRDPSDEWPAERSLLIVGIPYEDARRLGSAFSQNAIVFVEKGQAPELVVLAP